MNDMTVLIGEQLEEAVQSLNLSWAVLPGRGLVRVVPTPDFASGFTIVARVAKAAEQFHFEPELTLRHHEVEISLPAYSHGGVTVADITAAGTIDGTLQ